MTDLHHRTRQNACKGCTKAKRACDRKLPQCGRCADKLLECRYFPKARQKSNATLAPRPSLTGVDQSYDIQSLVGVGQVSNEAVSQQDNITALQPLAVVHVDLPSPRNHTIAPEHTTRSTDLDLSWFLAQSSWDIKYTSISAPASPPSIFRGFVKTAQGWLRDWASHGHGIFIHRQLYPSGLPTCLEDAYTALVTYLAKTEETEDMVSQIIENRVTSLCPQSVLLENVETLDAMAHLARTQALLVYTLIGLFDGCPRQRVLAEDTLSTLYQWCHKMRNAAIEETPRLYQSIALLQPGDAKLELTIWQAWILSECLRRTWMLASTTVNIYQTRKDGWSGCAGMLTFTVRRGLWEASNAWQWAQKLRKHSSLFTQNMNSDELMQKIPPDEIDTFAYQVIAIVQSPEQMDRWAARTLHTEL